MTYFKIIQNNTIIDVGFIFLKWNEKHHQLFACDANVAQCVQGCTSNNVYRSEWMKPTTYECEQAQVMVIAKDEFERLKLELDGGETIEISEPAEPAVPEIEPSPDMPMSVPQMREIIKDQQEQIETLVECILEMSETVYGM